MANPIIQSIEEQLAKIREDVAGKQAQFQKVQQYGYQPQEQIIFNQSGDVMPRDIYPSIDSPSQEEQSIQKALFESQGGQYNPQSGGYNFTAPNQEDVYQRTMGLFQDQINALDQFYAQKKSEMTAQLAQKSYGELGQQRAILGSSGMLGQVSGMAQKAGLQGEQAGRLKTAIEGIEGEQNYKKSQLFGQVREMAQSEYQSKMSAFQEGVGGYLTYLKDKKSKQQENIGAIIQTALVNDIDLSKDDGWLSKYAQELGVKPGDIISQYTQKKSEFDAQQAEAQAQAIRETADLAYKQAQTYALQNPDVKYELTDKTGRLQLIQISGDEVGKVIEDYGPVEKTTNETGLTPQIQSQVDKLSGSFDSAPITKQFNDVLNKKLNIKGIIDLGVGGPGDLALVYDFMKALDPTSVVRESEYANAAKSGNIFSGWAAKFNGYMNEQGGILPENVKSAFSQLIDKKFDVVKSQYDNLRNETARKINMKTGQNDGLDYLTNYDISDTTTEKTSVDTPQGTFYFDTQEEADSFLKEINQSQGVSSAFPYKGLPSKPNYLK